MVVSAAVQAVFVAHNSVLEVNLEGESTLGQQLQRPIDSRVANGWILLFDETVQIFRAQVAPGGQEDFKNPVPLGTLL